MEQLSLARRRAVVTGGGRGIGRAVALMLARNGAAVTLVARSSDELAAVADEIRAESGGAEVRTIAGDVRDATAMTAVFTEADADILVTAAGINRPGPVTEMPIEELLAVLDINVAGTLIPCREFGRCLLAAGRTGAVVTLSSQMGVVGYPGRVAYCASKHAINGMTKALALEWASHGIRVNAVAPTFIETPFTQPMLADPAFRDEVLSRIPLGEIGTVDDVVGAVEYLLSPTARLVTGHVLAVDGGWTVQ